MMMRRFLTVLASFMLFACSVLPEQTTSSALIGTPVSEQPPAEPGTLAASVPVAEWRNNLHSNFLLPLDPESGMPLKEYEPIEVGQAISHAFSPDGETLAVIGFVSSEHPAGGSLHLIDLNTWEDSVLELQLDGYVNAMDFSPDGEQLAIAYGSSESQALVLDIDKPFEKSKTTMRQAALGFLVYKMRFNAEGSGLLVYGTRVENSYTVNEMSPEPAIVNLLDSDDLSLRWQAELQGVQHGIVPKDVSGDNPTDLHQPGQAIYLFPGLAFAPNQDTLYVAHPDEDKLTTVDFAAQKVSSVEIKPKLSLFERLLSLTAGIAHAKIAEGTSKQAVLSPDGRHIYIIGRRSDLLKDSDGNWQVQETPLGLQIVDTKDGRRVTRIDTEAREVAISPDGRHLYLRGWGDSEPSYWTQIFDTSTKKFTARMDGMWLVPTRRANGAPVLASSVWIEAEKENDNAFLEGQSVLAEWTTPDYLAWMTIP